MKLIIRITVIALLAAFSAHVSAQWSWGGSMYYGLNFHADSIKFNSNVTIFVADGYTVTASRVETGNHNLTKMGGGRFVIDSVNLNWTGSIYYSGKADTIMLKGMLGQYVNDSIGYNWTGALVASTDTVSLFTIDQIDTVTQTFNTQQFSNVFLFEQFSNSYSRFVKSNVSLKGSFNIYNGGTALIDGMRDVGLIHIIDSGRVITGQSATRDVAYFDKRHSGYDTIMRFEDKTTLQIGDYYGPSLARFDGSVYHDGTLEIDVYDPNGSYSLNTMADFQGQWQYSFSDRVALDSGRYSFGNNAKIKPAFNPAFSAYIEDSATYYLPVIMFNYASDPQTVINNPERVTVVQTLPGWILDFVVGDGTNGTVNQWGYLHFTKVIMHKSSRLIFQGGSVQPVENGTYPNPVAVMASDTVVYMIAAINATQQSAAITVIDVLPPYLNFSSASHGGTSFTVTSYTPPRDSVVWSLPSVPAGDTLVVSVKAVTQAGSTASQPLYINTAVVKDGDLLTRKTTMTYHQGAGISMVTFSASVGGSVFNVEPQVVEFGSSPRSAGLLVVPDHGYKFTGWSHPAYISHREAKISAAEGITDHSDVRVYGDVELTASFTPIKYPVTYYLDGGKASNPSEYTIETSEIRLEAPVKAGDEFIGWTGSNGDTPEKDVVIPQGSTGERYYYANYLSGYELNTAADNNIWTSGEYLYIRTDKAGGIVKIYTPDGILHKQQTIRTEGVTKIKLPYGIYIVRFNDSSGKKVMIEK